jgi:hypothetical protein
MAAIDHQEPGVEADFYRPARVDAFINLKSGKCLDKSMDNGNAVGAQIYQYTCHFGANQLWWSRSQPDHPYSEIYNAAVTNQCLDLKNFGYSNGTTIQSWYCSGGWNQQWWFGRA